MNLKQLERDLMRHEGYRQHPYDCGTGQPVHGSVGKITIGYGRNLEARGIEKNEARQLLLSDIFRADAQAATLVPDWVLLGDVRQGVLTQMVFQLGAKGVEGFKLMRAAIAQRNFDLAAREMMNSNWAQQCPERARELAARMRTGTIAAEHQETPSP